DLSRQDGRPACILNHPGTLYHPSPAFRLRRLCRCTGTLGVAPVPSILGQGSLLWCRRVGRQLPGLGARVGPAPRRAAAAPRTRGIDGGGASGVGRKPGRDAAPTSEQGPLTPGLSLAI